MDKSYLKIKLNRLVKITTNWIVLSLLSSFLLILVFSSQGISILSWVALTPFFLIILKERLGRVILSSIIINFVFNFFYLIWLKEYKQPLTFPLSLIAESIYLIPQAILAWLIYRVVPKYFKTFALAATWVLFDYLKSVGFLAFPWGIIGYAMYKNILLIQSASIFGVWGVDFLVLFSNSALILVVDDFLENRFLPFKFKRYSVVQLCIAFSLIIFSFGYGFVELGSEKFKGDSSIKLSLIQANFNPWSPNLSGNLEKEFDLTRKSQLYKPEMIIWSESSVPFPFDYYLNRKNKYAVKFDNFIKSLNKPVIFGSLSFKGIYKNGRFIGDFYNVAYFYKPEKGYQYYRKIHLVPFGEWFPYKRLFPFAERILEKAGAGDFKPGTKYTVFKNQDLRFNVLTCFEDVFGNLARKFVKNGSRMLINVTNDAWSGSKKAEIQHFTISIFRAVENRVPLVRVANGGVTAYIDPYGRIVQKLPLFKSDFLICDVNYRSISNKDKITFYTRYGDFLPFVLLISILFILLIKLVIKIVDIILNKNNM